MCILKFKYLELLVKSIICLIIIFSNHTSVIAQNFFENSKNESSFLDNSLSNNISLEIVSEHSTVSPGEPINLGILINHKYKWHTYWVNPGDTGLPTSIIWNFSKMNDSWKISPIEWPSPKRFLIGSLANFGYDDEVLLIQKMYAPNDLPSEGEIIITADVSWLECKDICIPGNRKLSIKIPVTSKENQKFSEDQYLFQKYKLSQPINNNYKNSIKFILDEESKNFIIFQKNLSNQNPIPQFKPREGLFFPISQGLIIPSGDQSFFWLEGENSEEEEKNGWMLVTKLADNYIKSLEQIQDKKIINGVFVDNFGNGESLLIEMEESNLIPQKGSKIVFTQPIQKNNYKKNVSDLILIMFFSFLGGVLLNLMPCVFPVLSLKILSIAEGLNNKKLLFEQSLFFVLGILLSVMTFAIFFIILREFGQSVGWGIQLQNTWVVLSLLILFVAIALNLSGVFEFGNSLTVLGNFDKESGKLGAFLSGILTVVVASPCTAPFMGGAIGFAATAEIQVVLLIFLFLGLGISFPYFVLIINPNLLSILPKPGKWMVDFRQFLAFPMFAAAGWLIWVLVELKGNNILLPTLFCILFFSMSVWLFGKSADLKYKTTTKNLYSYLGFFLLLVCLYFFNFAGKKDRDDFSISVSEFESDKAVQWIQWNEDLAIDYVEKGYVVFIDFTASWCITCQANKVRVLDSKRIIDVFSKPKIVTMRADWTNSDDKITKALIKYGRIGVPLNVIMSQSLKEPIILSEWLTIDELIKGIELAQKN